MNDLISPDQENKYPINVEIRLSTGDTHVQPLEIDSDGAQAFMDWFRNKKASAVWTWQVPTHQKISMIHRCHIASVDIKGYIEPEGRRSKWYERLLDKIRVKFL
jgi:hypothetical protein